MLNTVNCRNIDDIYKNIYVQYMEITPCRIIKAKYVTLFDNTKIDVDLFNHVDIFQALPPPRCRHADQIQKWY